MSTRENASKRKIQVGDLDQPVNLRYRDLQEPAFDEADLGLSFSEHIEVMARIKTTSGKTYFDGVNAETAITHVIDIRYEEGVNSLMWIELLNGSILDILDVENLDEDYQFLRLVCTDQGERAKASTRS